MNELSLDGRFDLLFVHLFCHRELAYPYADGWMARNYFTAGTMPSADLLLHFQDHLLVVSRWQVSGIKPRTAEAWLARLEENEHEIAARFGTRLLARGASSSSPAPSSGDTVAVRSRSCPTASWISLPDVTRLRAANLVLAVLHSAQAVAIVLIGATLAIPITASWAQGPPGTEPASPETLFDLPVRWCVAAFLLMAALDHLVVALPGAVSWYERNLDRGINYARWIEYSFSASLMVVLIATFAGVTDLRALIAVAGANAAMILFGLLMERVNVGRDRLDWLPFWFGCLAGAVPWIVIGISLVGSEIDGSVPGFVWGIFVSLFLFFNSFAANMWLQYRGIGPWRRYVFGEWGYLVLSLTAKSALAWQIYAGALAT